MSIDAQAFRAARASKGLSQEQLAALGGTSQTTIDKIERGETRSSKFLPKLASALGVPLEQLDQDFMAMPAPRPPIVHRPPVEFLGERDLPVFAAAEGGPGEMVVSTEPIEIVQRPWYLREVRDGYAVLIVGDSMEPAFEPGDMAIVNPRLPPMRNRDTIFVSGEERGEFRATIKRLIRWDADSWHVRQFNEPKDFELDRGIWSKALRVVGKFVG